MGYRDDSLGVSGDPHMRSLWLGLSCGNERLNSIIDRGLGECVGHALRVLWQVPVFPMGN